MKVNALHAKIRKLVVAAMMTAIIWMLTITPIGFTIPFFGISMTFVHIPMIIGTLMEGLGVGTVLGGMFGLTSLFNAFTRPSSIYSPLFQNPLVSVLPRLLIAPATWGVYCLLKRLLPGKDKTQYAIAGACGALFNTLFTLTALTVSNAVHPMASQGVSVFSIWALSINAPFEAASAGLIAVAVMTALRKVYKTAK